jgi:hypothetical protein
MATTNRISPREQIQNELVSYLNDRGNINAPYGILTGMRTNKVGGKFREITFGKSRTLDATIQIHGDKFFVFRWQGSLRNRSHGMNSETFTSKAALIAFLDEAL